MSLLQVCHAPQSLEVLQKSAVGKALTDAKRIQAELLSPFSPTKAPPGRQGPQVCAVEEHDCLLSVEQLGAALQLTLLSTALTVEITCFNRAALPLAIASWLEINDCKEDWLVCSGFTITLATAGALLPSESNIPAKHDCVKPNASIPAGSCEVP